MRVQQLAALALGAASIALIVSVVPINLLLEIILGITGGLYVLGTLFVWGLILSESSRPLWHIIYMPLTLLWPFYLGQRIYWWSKGELTS